MMISPEVYIDEKNKLTLEQLYKEREELIKAIKMYESGEIQEGEIITMPSLETIYKYNKDEYLPRLEILIAEREKNCPVSFRIDDYTDFYIKIIRKNKDKQDPDDRWCDVSIYIKNHYFKYNNSGELLLEDEVINLKENFEKLINNELKEEKYISFIEPDLEFKLYTNGFVDLKVNLFEDGALSPNYYNLCLNREEIRKICDYITQVFTEKHQNREYDRNLSNFYPKENYYYLTVKYDEYVNEKTYCYISEDTTVEIGDKVVVDMADNIVIATVLDANYYTKETAPYPVEKTKRIIEKVTEETDLEEYDLYYDNFDEDDEDDYVSVGEIRQREDEINKLHKIIMDTIKKELTIKRLMKLLPMKDKQELYVTLYYSQKLNLFIYGVASDFYILPEYGANLFKKKEYKEIIKNSIIVPRKLYENTVTEEEIYLDAIKFCEENNIKYIDDYKEQKT